MANSNDTGAASKGVEAADTHPKTNPSNAQKENVHALLRTLHETLRGYERHHLAKVPGLQDRHAAAASIADTQAKARRNGDLASRIERWQEANPPLAPMAEQLVRDAVVHTFERETGKPLADAPPEVRANVALVQELALEMCAPVLRRIAEDGSMETYDAQMARLAIRAAVPLLNGFHQHAGEAMQPQAGETVQ
jgi:hypothetical protein